MDPAKRPRPTGPMPRARVAFPLLALVAAAMIARPAYDRSQHPTESDVLGMASARGILPVESRPAKGTPIYQWDPELHDFPPFLVGDVVDPSVRSGSRRYTLVKRPHYQPLLLDIQPGGMRYWVHRP